MTTNNKAEEREVETDTTQTDSPPVEEQTVEEQEIVDEQSTDVQTEVKESDDQGSVIEDTVDVPVETEEQRRAFQEQRQEIKRLKSEIQNRNRGESAFQAFRPQTPPAGQHIVNIEDFQDPITGETNWQAYNQSVNNALNQVRQSATYEAQQAIKEEIDENNARNKYPDMFADPEIEQEIADRWIAARIRGENPSITDLADRVSKRFSKTVSKAEKIGAEKILNEVSEKEQASLNVSSQTSAPAKQAASAEKLEELSRRSRYGDDDAITARVSEIPWANK